MQNISFNIRRPFGPVSLTLNTTTGEVTRQGDGWVPTTTRTLPLEGLAEGLKMWEGGNLIQTSLPRLPAEDREWLMTGLTD